MIKIDVLCKQIARDIEGLIEDAVIFNDDHINYEVQYGAACVTIEIGNRASNGWLQPYTEVAVTHDDASHTSPRLTAAIEKVLPDWTTIANKIEMQMEYLA